MSNTVVIVVTDTALDAEGSQTLTYRFDNATIKDLQHHISKTLDLSSNSETVIKWKTKDLYDNTMISTMNSMAELIAGETYFALIDTWADMGTRCSLNTTATTSIKVAVPVPDSLQGSLNDLCRDNQGKEHETMEESEETRIHTRSNNQTSSMTTESSNASTTHTLVERMLIPNKALPCQLLRGESTTQAIYLANLYIANQGFMDEAFKEMIPVEKTMVETIDVIEFFSKPATIASLVFLRDETLASFDLSILNMARMYAKKSVTDIIAQAYKDVIPSNALDPLITLMLQMTGNTWFSTLAVHGFQSAVVMAVKKRRVRNALKAGESPRLKKPKLTLAPMISLDLDDAAKAITEAQSTPELDQLVANTSQFRCQWLNAMDRDFTRRNRRIETMVAKFPCFLRNAALFHHDFKYIMENIKQQPVFNVSLALHRYAPAIVSLGKRKGIFLEDVHQDIENDMLQVCKMLIDLVPFYCRRNKTCTPDRLIVEGEGFISVQAMADARKELGQKAGMILAFDRNHGKSFYVSIDDQSFKVTGDFADALQSMMEIHYIFDAEYAPELENFHIILEHLGGLDITGMKGNRADLYFDLLYLHKEIQGKRNGSSSQASQVLSDPSTQSNGSTCSTKA